MKLGRSVAKPARKGMAWLVAAALLAIMCSVDSCASPVAARVGMAAESVSHLAAPTAVPTPADFGGTKGPALAGAGRRLPFRRLTIEDGLSQSTITCIAQDSRGFIWFGTQDGLNRYDGYDFWVYKRDPNDPGSLTSNWIMHCHRDRRDNLWFVTDDSVLHRYDLAMDRFEHYPIEAKDPNRRGAYNILTLYGDSSGRLWIGTYGGGLVQYDPDTDHLVYYSEDLDDASREGVDDNKVYTIYEDSAGTLWFGTGEGLVRYDPQAASFVRYPYHADTETLPEPGVLRSPYVAHLYEDRSGRLWVGTTYGGLHQLDRDTGRFRPYPYSPGDPNTFSGNSVRSLLEDRDGKLWVASAERKLDNTFERLGLERLDPDTGEITRFLHDPDDPCSLSHNAVLLMREDRQGTLWFHTFAGGVDLYDRQTGCFTHYQHDPIDARTLSDDSITAFHEDESGGVWLGTDAGGISFYHPTWARFPYYAVSAAPMERQSNNSVFSFHAPASAIDPDGHVERLWIATGAGVNHWDRRTGIFTFYEVDPAIPDIMPYALYEDDAGTLWLGSGLGLHKGLPAAGGKIDFQLVLPRVAPQVGLVSAILPDRESDDLWLALSRIGLARFDPAAGEIVHTYKADPANPEALGDDIITRLFPGSAGTLWIATATGLDHFDPATETFVHYRHDPDNPHSLSDVSILWIYDDQKGTVWSGTNGDGFQRLDLATGTWSHYREEDGLPNDVVYAILPERVVGADTHLWLSTNRGLSRFDLQAETFRNYSHLDGLQSNEFNAYAAYAAPDGEILLGGVEGINAFYPDQVWDDPYTPPVYITGLLLANQPATIGSDGVLDRSIEVAQSARLSYRDRVVSFEFAALYYAMPERVQYAYMLEGFDEEWIAAGKRRFATYTSLPPRDYVFRVKAANADGVWNETGASLAIAVAPPVWATWWFRGLAAVLVVGALVGGYRFRVRSVEARARALEQQVTVRTGELSALNAIASVVSASLNLEQILGGALEKTLDVTGREAGGIYLLQRNSSSDPDHDQVLKVVAHRGIGPSLLAAIDNLQVGEGFSGHVAATGKPLLINDLAADGRLTRLAVTDEGYRSVAIAPLLSRGEVLGSLFVMSKDSTPLEEEDLDLLTSIAGQVAVAVENARLYADTEHRLAQITALQETSTAVASTLQIDHLLHLITQQASALFQAGAGILNLVDWDRMEDEPVACVGAGVAGIGYRTPLDRGLSGWIALHNQPTIALDLPGDSRVDHDALALMDSKLGRPVRNAAGVPLVIKGQVVGSLILIDKLGGQAEFDRNDLDLLVAFANQAATAIENARLFNAEQRRAEQFRVIGEVGQRVTSILEIDEVLSQVVRLIQEAFAYDHVGIALVEGDCAVYKVGAGVLWDDPEFEFSPSRLKVGQEGITGWVAATGRSLLIPDVRLDPRYVHMEGSRTQSEAIVPLQVKGEIIGVLDVQSNRLNAFDQSDLAMLESLATQAAVAIKNAQLFKAEQRRAEQFRVISEVGSRVASLLTVEEVIDQVARLIQKAFDYYLVEIGLVEETDLVFKTRASRVEGDRFDQFHLPVDQSSVTGWVAATGEPLLVPDVSQEARYVQATTFSSRSELAVPMKTKDHVIGVINVQSERVNAFDESDLNVLQSLANQAAITIENARLYEQAQQLAIMEERSRLARELHDAVTQTLFSASLLAEALPEMWENDPNEGRELLGELRQLSRGALAEMRTLLLELRPAVLIESNLRDLIRQLGEAVAGRAGIPVDVAVGDLCPLPDDVHVALYRIAQEALNNVVKHAQARQVQVRLHCPEPDGKQPERARVELCIADDGRGFDPVTIPTDRLGIGIIRERASAIGASCRIDSCPGNGTCITIVWKEAV
ncbi:MAG: GAF domain-containing protein [Anaerolineae bacterium]|nr:GAF domain-containing protein [Anaerolineae bacterium]